MQSKINDISRTLTGIREWVEQNRDVSDELKQQADEFRLQLARTANQASACAAVLPHRLTVGVFGASQAGKSYLVSAMAAGSGDKPLVTNWGGQQIDFIKHVNPQGQDREATGFVTRFTHERKTGCDEFPIVLRVLSVVVIVMILVNSFFNDLNQNTIEVRTDEDKIEDCLKRSRAFLSESSEQGAVSFEEVIDLADYVLSHTGGSINTHTLQSKIQKRRYRRTD